MEDNLIYNRIFRPMLIVLTGGFLLLFSINAPNTIFAIISSIIASLLIIVLLYLSFAEDFKYRAKKSFSGTHFHKDVYIIKFGLSILKWRTVNIMAGYEYYTVYYLSFKSAERVSEYLNNSNNKGKYLEERSFEELHEQLGITDFYIF